MTKGEGRKDYPQGRLRSLLTPTRGRGGDSPSTPSGREEIAESSATRDPNDLPELSVGILRVRIWSGPNPAPGCSPPIGITSLWSRHKPFGEDDDEDDLTMRISTKIDLKSSSL